MNIPNLHHNSIRVCFVIPKAYPLFHPEVKGVFGGAEVDLYRTGTELAHDADFDVSFVVADYGQAEEEEQNGIRIIKSLDFQQNSLRGAKKIWHALRQADADIYFLETFSPGVPLAAYFCKRYDRKLLYRTAHAHECDGTLIGKHWLLGKTFVWALRRAQAVITQNVEDARNLLETTGISSQVIPNGQRLPCLDLQGRDTVLWVSRSADFKNPHLFIQLARELPDEKFCMICPQATGDRQYDSLTAQAEQVDNLEFISSVPFQDIDSYFQKAKVFVNTSDSEGFPNTFIQACKWGTPILSLQVNPDVFLDRHQCGKCAKGNWERFVQLLAELAEPGTQTEYGKNARRYVEEHHDIKKIIEEYKRIFRELVR